MPLLTQGDTLVRVCLVYTETMTEGDFHEELRGYQEGGYE